MGITKKMIKTERDSHIVWLYREMQGLYRFCDYPNCSLPNGIIEEYKNKMIVVINNKEYNKPSKELTDERYDGEFKEINKWLKKNGLPKIEIIKIENNGR